MQTLRTLLAGPLVLITALSSSVFGQDHHAVDRAALADAVSRHADRRNVDRAAIREALGREAVREVAAKAGIDVEQLAAAIGTMTGADLERAASVARDLNESLIGGASTVVISTTTIIIVLLIILLVVALK